MTQTVNEIYVAFALSAVGMVLWLAGFLTFGAARSVSARRTGNFLCAAGGVFASAALACLLLSLR